MYYYHQKHYKKSVLFVIRALCKHNPETADSVAKAGGLETLIICLEDFEIAVRSLNRTHPNFPKTIPRFR